MEKAVKEIVMLYDLYGTLLTENQKNVIELYYYEDLSLGEISENLQISRQAVRDSLKRAENILYNLEEKLSLINKTSHFKEIIKNVNRNIDLAIQSENQAEKNKLLFNIKNELSDIF